MVLVYGLIIGVMGGATIFIERVRYIVAVPAQAVAAGLGLECGTCVSDLGGCS